MSWVLLAVPVYRLFTVEGVVLGGAVSGRVSRYRLPCPT